MKPQRKSAALLAPLLLGLAAAGTVAAQGVEGRIVQTQGEVRINGAPASGGTVPPGALLETGANGRFQMRTANGTFIALPAGSRLQLAADSGNAVTLLAGGLRLNAMGTEWRVNLADRSLRTNGFVKLQACAAGCDLPPGLYGRVVQGEAVLEYRGGRSLLRARSFRWVDAASRPEVLASAPALLDDANNQADALQMRTQVTGLLKQGMEAFGASRDDEATKALLTVGAIAPGEPLVPYYLGLIALRKGDNENGLRLLQQYSRDDPEGAAQRGVPQTMTLLASTQLQQEMASAVARERELVATPPEPGSIAVQAFVNRGDDAYRALAKGLAAMIIADLSKVPGLNVLEREKVQVLVNEAKLGDSGLADTASAVRSGRLMRAEKVVVGNFEVK